MLNKDQSQDVGAGALGIQAGGNVIIGISASEARAIALDVAKATFYELTGVARDIMSARVEEITDKVISRLEKEFPEGLRKAVDPDFQHALFTVQKNYGRTGDKDLGDLLVDLLVDRSKQEVRDLMQIVLNESLEVAPKLTPSQLSILSVVFFFVYTRMHGIARDEEFFGFLDKHLKPFIDNLVVNPASYEHLVFAGCGTIEMGARGLEDFILRGYPFFFQKGITPQELQESGLGIPDWQKYFIKCLNDSGKAQVAAEDSDSLELLFEAHQTTQEDRKKISEFMNARSMSPEEVRLKCVQARPYMERVFDCWATSSMKSMTLTSVGKAIGHANVKRIVGEFADLSIWIN
ncbi:hypothetical protein HTX81_00705 [Pseudomonas lini]|uniref:LPO_1073/Vpar_1526 family protein n=1 Tax=Pseudomonas lini TaxID=163011 RepID=UPI000579282A|nr:LPO_1073/Vpar_1526 family protein [Pseudomonas lini]NSX07096.1 hypothetical protein [Pseudomonas lini]